MPDFILVTTLNGLQDLYIVQPLLESEGLNFYIKNENMIQMNPLYAVGTGGLDVMVVADDAPRAFDILKEAGYIVDENTEPDLPLLDSIRKLFYTAGDTLLSKHGLLGLIIAGLLLVIGLIIYYSTIETTPGNDSLNATDLRNSQWYVKGVSLNGQKLTVHTIDKKDDELTNLLSNNETINFDGFENVILPGLESHAVKGNYSIVSYDSLLIGNCDTLGVVYNGKYGVRFMNDGDRLEMKTDSLVIKLSKYL
jgi:hypothetical protein